MARPVPVSNRPSAREWGLLGALAAAGLAATAAVALRDRTVLTDGEWLPALLFVFGTLGYTAVGVVILWRRPGNGIGRLALTVGLVFTLGTVLSSFVTAMTPVGLVRPVTTGLLNLAYEVAVGASQILVVAGLVGGTVLLVAWFPSGRRTTRLGAVVEVGLVIGVAAGIVTALRDPILREVGWTPLVGTAFDIAPVVAILSLVGSWGLAVLDLAIRYRRAAGIERVQMRWVLAGAAASILAFVALLGLGGAIGGLWELWMATLMLPVGAVALAVTRYRLYDIDRIVSRSIGYAIVTAVLFGVFFGVNVILQTALGQVVGDSPVAVAASTLVVAALFQPLRSRVQSVVDRRFHRARYDAERTVAGFAGRLRDQLDLPTLTVELRRATSDAVDPSATTIWLRTRAGRSR